MNNLSDEIDDLRFGVLDNSNPQDPDHFFIPLIYLESFNAPALVLKIGEYRINFPVEEKVDWRILVGEPDFGDLEVISLTSLNDRGFKAFAFNPLSGFSPKYLPIEIVDAYQDVKWYFPKLKTGQMLCVPLTSQPKPLCVYFVKDISRQSEVVDIGKVW